MKQRGWIIFSGFVWLAIGAMLLYKGLHLVADGTILPDSFCSKFAQPETVARLLIGVALLLGFFKGRFVLSKTVRRIVLRIAAMPVPIRFKDVYPASYYYLIAAMMGLGLLFRFLPILIDLRGAIDIAIGSALINGAILYFICGKHFPVQSPGPDRAAQ